MDLSTNEGRTDPRSVPASRAALIGLGEIVLHVLAGVLIFCLCFWIAGLFA